MAKEKAKFSFARLTKRQKILFVTAIVLAAIIVALAIALPLTLVDNSRVPKPYFEQFDQKSDYAVVAAWGKVRGANSYTVEYCYGQRAEDNIKTALTTAERYSVDRRKESVLSLRVRANFSDGSGEFSEWITMDISALTLNAPTLEVSDDGIISWTEATYDFKGTRTAVACYHLTVSVDDGEGGVGYDVDVEGNEYTYLSAYLKVVISRFYEEGLTEWQDVVVTVKIKALSKARFASDPTEAEKYLVGAYNDLSLIHI